MNDYSGRCILNPAHKAVVIHEIIPRSLRPNDWWEKDNMCPLCHDCHDKIHREGTKKYKQILRDKVDARYRKQQ